MKNKGKTIEEYKKELIKGLNYDTPITGSLCLGCRAINYYKGRDPKPRLSFSSPDNFISVIFFFDKAEIKFKLYLNEVNPTKEVTT